MNILFKALAEIEKLEQEKKDLIQTLGRQELRYLKLESENIKLGNRILDLNNLSSEYDSIVGSMGYFLIEAEYSKALNEYRIGCDLIDKERKKFKL